VPKRLLAAPLPTLLFLNLAVGLARALEPSSRTSGPTFAAPKHVMPMHCWGLVFLAGAVLLAATQFVADRRYAQAVYLAGVALWTFWAFLIAASCYLSPNVSTVGCLVYVVGAVRHFQAYRRA
jgi:hypothetical protein